jgi:hypothetical protein
LVSASEDAGRFKKKCSVSLTTGEQLAAVVALVSPRALIAAIRTFPFHIAIWQEAVFLLRVQKPLALLVQMPAFQQAGKDISGHPVMVFCVRVGEQAVTDANRLLCVQEPPVIALKHLTRRGAFLFGRYGDWRSVTVRARNHQYVVPRQPMMTSKDIGREIRSCQMADVQVSVCIRPCDRHQNSL